MKYHLERAGLNTYTYVEGNPLDYIDSNGLAPKPGLGSGIESHNGGKDHVHWGNKSNPRQNAVNKDGSIRHGKKPTERIKKLINKTFGWTLKAPILLCPLCSVLDDVPKATLQWEDPDFCEI